MALRNKQAPAQEPEHESNGSGRKPDWSQSFWSAGGFVNVAIYENQGEKGTNFSTTLSRSYKEGDQWKKTASFRQEDLLVIAFACQKAYEVIANERAKK